jgi:putative flippase GtrA
MASGNDRYVYDDEAITTGPIAIVTGSASIPVQRSDTITGADVSVSISQLTGKLRQNLSRLIRYSATSAVSLGVSEMTLLILYSTRTFDATVAALIANLAGTVPSYLLSRYWIWADSDRKRVGRQVVLYWTTSFVAMAVTSVATGALTAIAPAGHRAHVLVAGAGFLGLNLVLWVAKYVVYQKIIFRDRSSDDLVVA